MTTRWQYCALGAASQNGHLKVVELLVANGADARSIVSTARMYV